MKKALLLFLFFTCALQAQITQEYKETPLQDVLTQLSKSYNLIFSFGDETIKNKVVTLAIDNTPLEALLGSLEQLTGLNFKKISDRQVIISAPANTLEVCGYLFDETTNEPLSFASIIIENAETGTITNGDGFFQLGSIDQDSSISIQHVGYKDKTMSVENFKGSQCPRIPVFQESTMLEEVLIVEYITKGIAKNIDGSFELSKEDLGILPGQSEPDVLQSVQLIPGIQSPDETTAGIQIRGGSADQNLIVWDDIKMYNTGHFFGMLSTFNPNVIKSAKIFKGGADPKYGDRISGVIDISSDDKVPSTQKGGVGLDGTHANAFFKTPITKKIGIMVSGRRSFTDFYQSPTYNALSKKVFQNTKIDEGNTLNTLEEEERQNLGDNSFFFYDASIKLIADVSTHDKIMISSIVTKNDLAFEIEDDEDLITDDLEIQNQGVSFSWTGTKSKNITHRLKTYYANYDSDYLFLLREEETIEETSLRKNTVEDIGVDLALGYDLDQKNKVLLGYQFSNTEVFYNVTRESDFETPINESDLVNNTAHTLYANYKLLPRKKGFINLGARVSYYSVVDNFYVEPRLNIEYPIHPILRIKGTAELRFQPISQLVEFEDTQLRLANNIWIHANDDIPVLESLQFSGGFLFSKNDWNIEVDGYYKNIDGLTSFTNGFNTAQNDLSTGKSRIMGVDLLLRKRINNFRAWLGYTFNDIEYTFPEIQENPFPGNNDITHNFRVSGSLEVQDWEFSTGWLWRSGAPFTNARLVDEDIVYQSANAERLPAYHRLDLSVMYKFDINQKGTLKGHFGASARNLYNRKVPLSISFQADENPDTDELELEELQQRSLGFTPNIVFRLSF